MDIIFALAVIMGGEVKQTSPLINGNSLEIVSKVATQLQLMDYREQATFFRFEYMFDRDIEEISQRYRDLSHMPYIEDGQRFPDRDTVLAILAANSNFIEMTRIRMSCVNEETLREAYRATIAEANKASLAWDRLRDARAGFYFVTYRRKCLSELRAFIGEQDYYSGVMPPFIPLGRLREIR